MGPSGVESYGRREAEGTHLSLRASEGFVFIDENDDQAHYEEHEHGRAEESVVAVDVEEWDVQFLGSRLPFS